MSKANIKRELIAQCGNLSRICRITGWDRGKLKQRISQHDLVEFLAEVRAEAFYRSEDKLIDLIEADDRDAIELVYRLNVRIVNQPHTDDGVLQAEPAY